MHVLRYEFHRWRACCPIGTGTDTEHTSHCEDAEGKQVGQHTKQNRQPKYPLTAPTEADSSPQPVRDDIHTLDDNTKKTRGPSGPASFSFIANSDSRPLLLLLFHHAQRASKEVSNDQNRRNWCKPFRNMNTKSMTDHNAAKHRYRIHCAILEI